MNKSDLTITYSPTRISRNFNDGQRNYIANSNTHLNPRETKENAQPTIFSFHQAVNFRNDCLFARRTGWLAIDDIDSTAEIKALVSSFYVLTVNADGRRPLKAYLLCLCFRLYRNQ